MNTCIERAQHNSTTDAGRSALFSNEYTRGTSAAIPAGILEVWQGEHGSAAAGASLSRALHVARRQSVDIKVRAHGVMLVRIKDVRGHVLAEDLGAGDLECRTDELTPGDYCIEIVNRAAHDLEFLLSVHGDPSPLPWNARIRSHAA